MKKMKYNLLLAAFPLFAAVSCGVDDDDFTASIFDTTTSAVDATSATAPFDQWLYDTFVVPYNVEIDYRYKLQESGIDYQVTAAGYEQSQAMAWLLKYLFYQPYEEVLGAEFLRQNSPRQFRFVGSYAVATDGTVKVGYAKDGILVSLRYVNGLNLDYGNWTESDIDALNTMYFRTIHHEFGHVLHMRRQIPSAFRQLTASTYNASGWSGLADAEAHAMGYVTPYAAMSYEEDFAETFSSVICTSDEDWMTTIIDATANGMLSDDRNKVMTLIDSLRIAGLDDASKPWNNFTANGVAYTSFRDYLDNVPVVTSAGASAFGLLQRKVEILSDWCTTNWSLPIFSLRTNVQQKQSDINDFMRDEVAPNIFKLQ